MLKEFLNKYDTIIFDMDGVITGEQNYWNCAALTVTEYLNGYFGQKTDTAYLDSHVKEVRRLVFPNDKLITLLKSKGVNSNWDLGYVTACISIILNTREPELIYKYAENLNGNILYEYDMIADKTASAMKKDISYTCRNGRMWQDMHECFQEWFLGEKLYARTYNKPQVSSGKKGLVYGEEPIIEMKTLKTLLSELSEDRRLCIGTGRPSMEIIEPLKKWDCLKYFDQNGIITYDYVIKSEKSLGINALTKPHPYMFCKALFGSKYSDAEIINGDYNAGKIKKALVVGDAGSDIMAAKAMGADFCAVLTGVAGQDGREYFEKMNAKYILNSVEEFLI